MSTTAEKLQKLMQTKDDIKTAINDPALGDRFADYPVAITEGKAYIAQKITEKGVAASRNDTFQQLGDKVGEIQSGGAETVTGNLTNSMVSYVFFDGTDVVQRQGNISDEITIAKNSNVTAHISKDPGNFSVSGGEILETFTLSGSYGDVNLAIIKITDDGFMVTY